MSEDHFTALLSAAASDAKVRSAFAGVSSAAEVVDIAASIGYDVSVDEVEAHTARVRAGEMTDDELEHVAGGQDFPYGTFVFFL